MEEFFNCVTNYRHERKFRSACIHPREVEWLLKIHPAIFREIYHQRSVNNIYLDLTDLNCYFDHLNGHSQRVKYRIRWYGNLFGEIANPVLEIKLKHNEHVAKLSYPLEAMCLDKKLSTNRIRQAIQASSIPQAIKFNALNLQMILLNTYERK